MRVSTLTLNFLALSVTYLLQSLYLGGKTRILDTYSLLEVSNDIGSLSQQTKPLSGNTPIFSVIIVYLAVLYVPYHNKYHLFSVVSVYLVIFSPPLTLPQKAVGSLQDGRYAISQQLMG